MDSGEPEVRFSVPLPGGRKKQELTFRLQQTVAELEGCIKVKQAVDADKNPYLMRILLQKDLQALPDAEEVQQRINAEIGYLTLLDHLNVLKVLQVFSTPERVYMLTEPCPQTLRDHVEKRGPLPEEEARTLFRQLLSATVYIHGKGLAHRALSPDSVFVDPQLEIKVAGLRGACLQSTKGLLTDRPSGLVPGFSAPELAGTGEYSGKMADVWSCGALLHYMLTAAPPPESGDLAAVEKVSQDAAEIVRSALSPEWKGGDRARPSAQALRGQPWVTLGQKRRESAAPAPLSQAQVRKSFRLVHEKMVSPTGQTAPPFPGVGGGGGSPTPPEEDDDEPAICDESFSPLPQGRRGKGGRLSLQLGGSNAVEGPDKGLELLPSKTPDIQPLSPHDEVPASPASKTRQQLNRQHDALQGTYQGAEVADDCAEISPMASKLHRGQHRNFAVAAAADQQSAARALEAATDSVVALAIEKVVQENEDYMERTGLQSILANMIVYLLGARPTGDAKYSRLLAWAREEHKRLQAARRPSM
eukprot:TRINITY_DN19206_c0_g1_i1.p1 TRINITY_DN19206_c0_g1~~TRINITY_DN19206_c0_g1_i1.p1  ORF type:complete len:555 (+),score=194.91 TRINITY_DN19206_c0_g1_i1:75-1667(+)